MKHLILRLGIVLLCALAVMDLRPIEGHTALPAIAALDVSRSMGTTRATLARAGVLSEPQWRFGRTTRTVGVGVEASDVDPDATVLGAPLRDIVAQFPGREVLVTTDGRSTDEDALRAARLVAARGGRLHAVVPDPAAADVGLRRARIRRGADGATVDVTVSASTPGRVVLRLLRSGSVVDEIGLDVAAGADGSATLRDPEPPGDGAVYGLTLLPAAGTPNDDPGNDALTLVLRGRTRRVLIWGDLPAEALVVEGASVRVVERVRPADFIAQDVIVLSNIPLSEMRAHVLPLLRFVATGGRLLVLGGADAYAGGGWSGSDWERDLCALHVRAPEGKGLALLLVLDRSGSTADASLGWLRDAAMQTVRGVVPGEQIAVLPFSAQPAASLLAPGWVRAAESDKHATLFASLRALQAGGDTAIPAAIEDAARRVATVQAQVHRVVVLTDGDPDKQIDPAALARARAALAQHNVGFGAIVVKMKKAVEQLRALAERPDDVVFLEQAAQIPDALAHVVSVQRGRRERVERPASPTLLGSQAALAGLQSLKATWVHDVRAAPGAVVLADIGAQRVPFAARRTVGAGAVWSLAWGPEVEPAGEARRAATTRLTGLIRALARQSDRTLVASFDGSTLVVRGPQGVGAMDLVSRDKTGATLVRATLLETEPGIYRGIEPSGSSASGWWLRGGGNTYVLDVPAQPDPESRGSGVDRERLAQLAAAGGGRVLRSMGEWSPARPGRGVSLAPWLLLLATIAFVADRFLARRAPS